MGKRGTSGINALVAINKPVGISSHGVVGQVRYRLSEKRVGHAGTLDPLASGLLIMGIGQATRLLGLITQETKSYRAHIEFGSQTTTDDAEGEVIATANVSDKLFDEVFAKDFVASLVGHHKQVPPQFSAISVNGQRAYKQARQGEAVELPERDIEIVEAKLVGIESCDPLVWSVDFVVSKGTYIRSIARDLGPALDTCAHLCGLERLSAGPVDISQALQIDDLEGITKDNIAKVALDPCVVMNNTKVYKMNEVELQRLLQGKTIKLYSRRPDIVDDDLVCMVLGDKMYGIWTCSNDTLRAKASFIDGIVGVRI